MEMKQIRTEFPIVSLNELLSTLPSKTSEVSSEREHNLKKFKLRVIGKIDANISAFTNKSNSELKKSMQMIDKLENKGFKLNPLIYLSNNEQSLLEEITMQYERMVRENNQARMIRDGYKESFQVFTKDHEYAKISREGRLFPLKIQILGFSGEFELYVSIKTERPSALIHEFMCTHHDKSLVVSYPEIKSNWLFIAIYGKTFTTLTLEARFNGRVNLSKPDRKPVPEKKDSKRRKGASRTSILTLESKFLFEEIEEIKRKRRKKMMQLAQDRDIVKCNKDLADNFERIRSEKLETSKLVRKIKSEKALIKKEEIDDFDTQRKILKIIKRDIKMQERAEEEKRKILLFRQYKWLQSLYLVIFTQTLYQELNEGRMRRIQQIYRRNFCQKIQRFYKKRLEKKNEVLEKEERNMIQIKRTIMMYSKLNYWAQRQRIIRIIPNFLSQTKFFFEFSDYFEAYRNKVVVIQRFYKAARKNKLVLLEKLYQRETQKLIEQDVKKTRIREKSKIEDEEEEKGKLPEGFAQASLADCIRNIKITEKERILCEYLVVLNLKFQEKYRKYKADLALYDAEQKRLRDEEYDRMVQKELLLLEGASTGPDEKKDEGVLITQPVSSVPGLKSEAKSLLFEELVDQVKTLGSSLPAKPIFNVFQFAEHLQSRLLSAIEAVKKEKKWVVL